MKATDLIVVGAVLLGILIAVAGLSQFDPRVRKRFGRREQSLAQTLLLAVVLVVVGLAIVSLAIG